MICPLCGVDAENKGIICIRIDCPMVVPTPGLHDKEAACVEPNLDDVPEEAA